MQGAPDITGAGYEYDLTWLYTLGTGYFIIVQNLSVLLYSMQKLAPFSLYFGMQYSVAFL